MASTEYTLIIYSPMEEVWFYEILFFQVVIVMVKDKKRCIVKDAMSIKTSFMHYKNYITWTRVKLPVVFEEFDMVYIFWLLFSFPLLLSVDKRSTLAKIWGDCSPLQPRPPPVSTGLNIYCYLILKLKFLRKTNFSEYQEMAAPTFLFIKVNYAFTHQSFNPSLLINKTIVKKRKEIVSFRFLTRNYRTEKTYNYG